MLVAARIAGAVVAAVMAFAATTGSSDEPGRRDTPSGQPVPRFVSLKYDEVNGRIGPSFDHEIAWRYQRASLPVEVVAETENWRKVRDPDGALVWMHRRTLAARRTVFVRGLGDRPVALRRKPGERAAPLARVEPGVVFNLNRCLDGWCLVENARAEGWLPAIALWGVYPEEAGASG